MSEITARRFSGTRDFLPPDMIPREELFAKVKKVFSLYGYDPVETPAIEYMSVLSGKYGEEADHQLYRLDYKTGSKDEAGLRYDLTVPLSRLMAMAGQEVALPFRRYQIQPVWRAERAQKKQGRYREFYQCDADCIGTDSMLADAEIVAMVHRILCEVGLDDAKVKVNDRKLLRAAIAHLGVSKEREFDLLRCVDKYDKVGISGVEKELAKRGFSTETVKRTVEFFATAAESQDPLTFVEDKLADNELGKLGLQELKELLGYCEELGLKRGAVEFDPLMVRGLDYYTGPIFEAVTDRLERMGSLAGGGRYDGLIGMFSGQQVPAVGATVGLDRIFTALEQLNLVTRRNTRARVLVAIFDEATAGEARKIAGELRASDIRTAVFPEPDKLRKQFRYADRLGVRYVVLAGPDELNRGTVTLKDLEKGEQREVTRGELVGEVRDQ